jgi:hypothetical protein
MFKCDDWKFWMVNANLMLSAKWHKTEQTSKGLQYKILSKPVHQFLS